MTKLASRLTISPTTSSRRRPAVRRWQRRTAGRWRRAWLRAVQRLGQVVHQVLPVLDADREADEPVVDAELLARLRRDRGVRHDGRVLDEGLDAAEDSAQVKRRTDLSTVRAAGSPPRTTQVSMPPKPRICLAARAWLRCSGRPDQ